MDIFTGGDGVGWGFERFIGLDWSMYQTCTEYICYVYLYIHKYYISERFPFMRYAASQLYYTEVTSMSA